MHSHSIRRYRPLCQQSPRSPWNSTSKSFLQDFLVLGFVPVHVYRLSCSVCQFACQWLMTCSICVQVCGARPAPNPIKVPLHLQPSRFVSYLQWPVSDCPRCLWQGWAVCEAVEEWVCQSHLWQTHQCWGQGDGLCKCIYMSSIRAQYTGKLPWLKGQDETLKITLLCIKTSSTTGFGLTSASDRPFCDRNWPSFNLLFFDNFLRIYFFVLILPEPHERPARGELQTQSGVCAEGPIAVWWFQECSGWEWTQTLWRYTGLWCCQGTLSRGICDDGISHWLWQMSRLLGDCDPAGVDETDVRLTISSTVAASKGCSSCWVSGVSVYCSM